MVHFPSHYKEDVLAVPTHWSVLPILCEWKQADTYVWNSLIFLVEHWMPSFERKRPRELAWMNVSDTRASTGGSLHRRWTTCIRRVHKRFTKYMKLRRKAFNNWEVVPCCFISTYGVPIIWGECLLSFLPLLCRASNLTDPIDRTSRYWHLVGACFLVPITYFEKRVVPLSRYEAILISLRLT